MSDKPQTTWRPIETAPKDREIVLAGRYLKSGHWDINIGQWLGKRFPFVGENQPTHWMELPDAPN